MPRRGPGIRKQSRTSWEISWYDRFHQRHFATIRGTYEEAVRERSRRVTEADRARRPSTSRSMRLSDFVVLNWRPEISGNLAPSTLRSYETALRWHVLPDFGVLPLTAITKPTVLAFIARKIREQRWDYTLGKNPNPKRPTLAPKTVKNIVAVLHSLLESAVEDYDLLDVNPLDGILSERRRRRFPTAKLRPRKAVHVLEPDDFKRAVGAIRDERVQRAVLFAALTGLRWGEQVALRIEEDVDWRRNRLVVTRSLYRRTAQQPKTEESIGEVPICPTVRRILKAIPWTEGFIFSVDGTTPIGDGSWVKREWKRAQVRAGIRQPIRWHALRHQFASLLIAAGKHPKQVADWTRHADPGFTLRLYAHLFESLPITPAEWWDDSLWPAGCPHVATPLSEGEPLVGILVGNRRDAG